MQKEQVAVFECKLLFDLCDARVILLLEMERVIGGFLAHLKSNAEQLNVETCMRRISRQTFRFFLDRMPPISRLLPTPG